MLHAWRVIALTSTVALLTSSISGCSTPPGLPPNVEPARIPPLPQEARQPKADASCLPTCSARLTELRESWRLRLMQAASRGQPVKPPMND